MQSLSFCTLPYIGLVRFCSCNGSRVNLNSEPLLSCPFKDENVAHTAYHTPAAITGHQEWYSWHLNVR